MASHLFCVHVRGCICMVYVWGSEGNLGRQLSFQNVAQAISLGSKHFCLLSRPFLPLISKF